MLDEAELARVGGYYNDHTLKIYFPLETYSEWFQEAGLKICNEIVLRNTVDDFFKKQSYAKDRLLSKWNNDETAMFKNMQIEFVEYMLEPVSSNQEII